MEPKETKGSLKPGVSQITEKLEDCAARERNWQEKDQQLSDIKRESRAFFDELENSYADEEDRRKYDDLIWQYEDAVATEEKRLSKEAENLAAEKRYLQREADQAQSEQQKSQED